MQGCFAQHVHTRMAMPFDVHPGCQLLRGRLQCGDTNERSNTE